MMYSQALSGNWLSMCKAVFTKYFLKKERFETAISLHIIQYDANPVSVQIHNQRGLRIRTNAYTLKLASRIDQEPCIFTSVLKRVYEELAYE